MAMITTIPEEIKRTILEFYFENEVVSVNGGGHNRKQRNQVPLFLVSKTLFAKDSILEAICKKSTLIIRTQRELFQITSVVQPIHRQQVKKIRTILKHNRFGKIPTTSGFDKNDLGLDLRLVRWVFPNIRDVDVRFIPQRMPTPIITLSESPQADQNWTLPENRSLLSFTRDQNDSVKEEHESGEGISDETKVSVAIGKHWYPLASFMKELLVGSKSPCEYNMQTYILLKKQSEDTSMQVRFIINGYVAKGRTTVEQMVLDTTSGTLTPEIRPLGKILDSEPMPRQQELRLNIGNHLLTFNVDGKEFDIPQSVSGDFATWEGMRSSKFDKFRGREYNMLSNLFYPKDLSQWTKFGINLFIRANLKEMPRAEEDDIEWWKREYFR